MTSQLLVRNLASQLRVLGLNPVARPIFVKEDNVARNIPKFS